MLLGRSREAVATVGLVSGGHFFSHFYLLTFPPLFPLLRSEFALTNTELGILVSVISAAMLLQIPMGQLVDRTGAKWVFVGGVATTALGIGLAGVAPSYPGLVAFATLSGIGQATFHPADYPLVEAVSAPERKGRNFSVHTFGGYAGFAVAPVAVGALGLTYGWRPALLAVGAAGVVYAAIAAVALPPAYRGSDDWNGNGTGDENGDGTGDGTSAIALRTVLRPEILIMSLFFVVVTLASKGVQTFTPILAVDAFGLTESVGNTALSTFFALTAVTVLVGGALADRYDPRYTILAATTAAAVTILAVAGRLVPVASTPFVALFGLAGGAYGMVFASRDRLVSTSSAAGSTGRSFGVVFTASSVGSLSSPILLGAVIDAVSATLAFTLVGAFFLLSGVVVIAIGRVG
jgi:MFS family permease